MSAAFSLALYSGLIVLGALAGAALALLAARQQRRLGFLAFASGVMLGAAFFHMLPEAFEQGGQRILSLVPLGFVFLFLLERYVLVHVCEEPPDCKEHTHGRALGVTAFLGLSVHTLFDGVALASAVSQGVGMMTFGAILSHKVPSSLSLAAILKAEGRSNRSVLLYAALFGFMVPLGAAAYELLGAFLPIEEHASWVLAFSAGAFLYVAVADLLPNVNRHGKQGRSLQIAALAAGLLVMFALSFFTEHPSHAAPGPGASQGSAVSK